jgi:hypothetical protein
MPRNGGSGVSILPVYRGNRIDGNIIPDTNCATDDASASIEIPVGAASRRDGCRVAFAPPPHITCPQATPLRFPVLPACQ